MLTLILSLLWVKSNIISGSDSATCKRENDAAQTYFLSCFFVLGNNNFQPEGHWLFIYSPSIKYLYDRHNNFEQIISKWLTPLLCTSCNEHVEDEVLLTSGTECEARGRKAKKTAIVSWRKWLNTSFCFVQKIDA